MTEIEIKIEKLGNVIFSKEKKENKFHESRDYIEELKIKFPKIDVDLINFLNNYGFSFFSKDVELLNILSEIPILGKKDNSIPIGFIYGFGNTKNSINYLRENYSNEDFINQDFIPICDGVAGDIIFYSLKQENFGKIYYWYHEGDYENDKFLVQNSFVDFITNLKISNNDEASNSSEVKTTFISPKMLDLMNKTRIKNGLPPTTAEELINKKNDTKTVPYKTYQGKDYTKEEWKKFEEEEYRKYVEKRSGKKSSFLADDTEELEKQNFSAESGTLKEVKYFVMNSRQDKVPVYEFPSAMVAPFTFLENGTAIEIVKYEKDGWCEILSKDKKKAYIQSTHVKKNE